MSRRQLGSLSYLPLGPYLRSQSSLSRTHPIQRIERVAGEACTRAETEAHCELANNETKLPKSEQRSISRFARKLSDFPNCARPRWQVP